MGKPDIKIPITEEDKGLVAIFPVDTKNLVQYIGKDGNIYSSPEDLARANDVNPSAVMKDMAASMETIAKFGGENLENLIFWGTGAVAATGLALISGKDCIEKIKGLYDKYISKDDYKGPTPQ